MVHSKYKKVLTIERVLKMIEGRSFVLECLPNEPLIHVTQPYLYTIVNTCDNGFFPKCQAEIDEKRQAKKVIKQKVTLEIDPAMQKLLTKFADQRLGKVNKKSLAGLGQPPKKRKPDAAQ
jgi:hypothetical protein